MVVVVKQLAERVRVDCWVGAGEGTARENMVGGDAAAAGTDRWAVGSTGRMGVSREVAAVVADAFATPHAP